MCCRGAVFMYAIREFRSSFKFKGSVKSSFKGVWGGVRHV